MVLGALIFATMGVCVKIASAWFSSAELVLYRRLIGIVFLWVLARSRGVTLGTRYPGMHAWRSLIGVVSLGAWFFAIVRNTWYTRVARRSGPPDTGSLDHAGREPLDDGPNPETQLLRQHTIARVRAAIEQLPIDFREVLVLREIEGLSYKEIASVVRVPIGTVMSRLARARERLQSELKPVEFLETIP